MPYYRGYRTETGKKLLGFYNTFKLNKSLSTSDKAGVEGNQPRLAKSLIYNNPLGMAPTTDVQKLIALALKPKPGVVQEQAKEIADLQAKIADSRRFAAYGEAKLNKWQRRSFSIR